MQEQFGNKEINEAEKLFREELDKLNQSNPQLAQITREIQEVSLEVQELRNKGKLNETEATLYTTLRTRMETLQRIKNDILDENTQLAEQETRRRLAAVKGIITIDANGFDDFTRRGANSN